MSTKRPDLVLPDEILEDIFIRLDDAADVVRASAACKSYRRVVSGNHRFLRRYQFLHPPPILGFLEPLRNGGFHPAETPHKSASAATSLAQAADFSFSFLPIEPTSTVNWRRSWCVRDARDGRVLLSRRNADDKAIFLDLVICDPLYRLYVQIPPIPENLRGRRYSTEMESEPFLLPAREEEEVSKVRVIYNWVSLYKIISFLFDSETKEWRVAASFNFLPERLIYNPTKLVRHYVGSCFYWVHRESPKFALVLDMLEMVFSIAGLPYGADVNGMLRGLAVVDAGVKRLGIVALSYGRNLNLHSKTWENKGGSPAEDQWQLDKHRTLPEGYNNWYIIGAAEGCLLLEDRSVKILQHFMMDPKTFLVQRFCMRKPWQVFSDNALLYARFPPSFTAPSI